MSNYHISKPDGTQEGPYDKAALFSLINNKIYTPDIYIWCEGMADWKPFREVFPPKKKAPAEGTAPPPPPPVPNKQLPSAAKKILGKIKIPGKTQKWLKPTAIMTAIISVACAGIWGIWAIFFAGAINSETDLYNYLTAADYTGCGGITVDHHTFEPWELRREPLRKELANKKSSMRNTRLAIIVCNSAEATKYILETRGPKKIHAQEFLIQALLMGADEVAETLIDAGVVAEDELKYNAENEAVGKLFWQQFLKNAYAYSNGRLAMRCDEDTWIELTNDAPSHDFLACAKLMVKRLNMRKMLMDSDELQEIIGELKFLGQEDLANYLDSIAKP